MTVTKDVAYRAAHKVLAYAEQDSDPVSVFVAGSSWEDAKGAVFAVTTREAALYLRGLCARQGLISEDKPIADSEAQP